MQNKIAIIFLSHYSKAISRKFFNVVKKLSRFTLFYIKIDVGAFQIVAQGLVAADISGKGSVRDIPSNLLAAIFLLRYFFGSKFSFALRRVFPPLDLPYDAPCPHSCSCLKYPSDKPKGFRN